MTINKVNKDHHQPGFLRLLWRYVTVAVLVWTGVIAGSLAWDSYLIDEQFAALAHKEAVANINKDQGFRLWGTKHGGVYVPVTEETPPSPYLSHVPERDIETPSGRKLTLLNPAYMVRQLMEDHAELYGVRGSITGLIVLRPGNAPDAWQKQALLKLKAGADEVTADTEIDGNTYHRMMRPMYMKPGCGKCHGHLGFKLGDFRGGVSVSVPLEPYIAAKHEGIVRLALTHGLIWALGMAGIGFGARQVRGRIDERYRADEQLDAHRARFETMLNQVPEAFVMMDGEHRIQLFSEGAANTFGYRPEEVLGKSVEILMPEIHRAGHAQKVRDWAAGGAAMQTAVERGEIMGQRKDGSVFSAEASVSRFQQAGETMYTAALRDITERKERDELLRQSQKMETVGQLTGGVSHDFNNILAAIIGNLDLIEDGAVDSEASKESIATALRAALRGAELTHRLLAFSRQQPLNAKLTHINEILQNFEQLAKRTIGENIAIELKLAADAWLTMVDVGRLENALLNLAINARDAMPDGGRLTIESANRHLEEDGAADFEDLTPGDYVMVAVSDTGSGMPAEVRERAFEPFFTTKDIGAGSGLGLSMVFGFARQSGGQVSIESKEWAGTTVRIYLPRSWETTDAESIARETQGDRPRGSETILVVEDEKDVLAYLVKALERQGYTVLQAGHGPAALEIMGAHDMIDLLLTDVILPLEMSGRDVAKAFQKRYPTAGVLYSSGYSREVLNSRNQLDEDMALISKPFRPHELARRVRRILDGRNQAGIGL